MPERRRFFASFVENPSTKSNRHWVSTLRLWTIVDMHSIFGTSEVKNLSEPTGAIILNLPMASFGSWTVQIGYDWNSVEWHC